MAADTTINVKIQVRQGGNVLAVASGGQLVIEDGGELVGPADQANGIGLAVPTHTTTAALGTTNTRTGSMVFDTVDSKIKVFNGSAWVASGALS